MRCLSVVPTRPTGLVDVTALSEAAGARVAQIARRFPPVRHLRGARRSYSAACMLSIVAAAPSLASRRAGSRGARVALVRSRPRCPRTATTARPRSARLSSRFACSRSTARGRAGGARVEVVVGPLDPRLRLAPCDRIEPYLPPGVRLWGKSRIGLRCKEGRTAWNVYLPIVVKVWGRALVVPRRGRRQRRSPKADLDEAEVDLAEEQLRRSSSIASSIVGRTLAQALNPGQAVRQAHLKRASGSPPAKR